MRNTLSTHTLLDTARQTGDLTADRLLACIGREIWVVNQLLRHTRQNTQPLPEGVPENVRHFLEEQVQPPVWLEPLRIQRAQRWAKEHIFQLTIALFFGSLPTAYAAEKGAKVLVATGRMESDLVGRLSETAHFVLDVIEPGSLTPSGTAIRAIQKVRLVHAALRPIVARQAALDEVPINQEDLLGTLFTFSLVVLKAMQRLGVTIDPRDAEDYFHLWRCVGAMLGIEEELLPPDLTSANVLAEQISERQMKGSAEGRLLMSTLHKHLQKPLSLPWVDDVPAFLTRYLVGDRLSDLLEVPVASGFPLAVSRLSKIPGLGRLPVQPMLRQISTLVGRQLLIAVSHIELKGERPSFPMPSSAKIGDGEPKIGLRS